MPRIRFISSAILALTLTGPISSAAPVPQGAMALLQPPIPDRAFLVDAATGALRPLESAKARKEGYGTIYCYIEGAPSTVTIRSDESPVFAFRLDGSPKYIQSILGLKSPLQTLEFLFVSDKDRRYATKKFVPMEGGPYGEIVGGVDPKHAKDVGQAFWVRPSGQLPPGEYGLSLGGMLTGTYPYPGCSKVVSAFRVLAAPPPASRAPSVAPPSPPAITPQAPVAPTNSAADIGGMRRAAEQGDVIAQYRLAWAYATGNGVPQDSQQTSQWLSRAADQGYADAQYWLGVMYRDALGLAPDQGKAALLFRTAAERGQPQAQATLGNFHFFGRGVPQDYVEAHKWLNIAAAQLEGEDRKACVELRDKVAGLMTPAQLAEAQKRATDWYEAFLRPRS